MSFPRYPAYKESGVDWLANMPAHWQLTRTKYVCDFKIGWTPPTGDALSYAGDNLWANISDLGPRLLFDTAKRISDNAIQAARIAKSPKGSLLFSFKLSIGQVSIAGIDLYTNEAIATFVLAEGITIPFEYYAFPIFLTHNASENIYGAKLLNQDLIRNARFPLPPPTEQIAITEFLDRETAKIDTLVAEQQRLIELLKEKRQAIISQAVTRGLDPQVSMKSSGVEWLGDVPAHWEVNRIANLFRQVADEGTEDLPVLSVSIHYGVSDKEIDEEDMDRKVLRSDDRSKYKRVAAGDLVYNMMRAWQGGFGTVTVFGMVSPAYIVARPIRPLETRYIEHLLRTPQAIEQMRRHSRGITDFRLRLYWDEFKNIRVIVPPRSEATSICETIDKIADLFGTLSAACEASIALLLERRIELISAAVTGQIDVRSLVKCEPPP